MSLLPSLCLADQAHGVSWVIAPGSSLAIPVTSLLPARPAHPPSLSSHPCSQPIHLVQPVPVLSHLPHAIVSSFQVLSPHLSLLGLTNWLRLSFGPSAFLGPFRHISATRLNSSAAPARLFSSTATPFFSSSLPALPDACTPPGDTHPLTMRRGEVKARSHILQVQWLELNLYHLVQ